MIPETPFKVHHLFVTSGPNAIPTPYNKREENDNVGKKCVYSFAWTTTRFSLRVGPEELHQTYKFSFSLYKLYDYYLA